MAGKTIGRGPFAIHDESSDDEDDHAELIPHLGNLPLPEPPRLDQFGKIMSKKKASRPPRRLTKPKKDGGSAAPAPPPALAIRPRDLLWRSSDPLFEPLHVQDLDVLETIVKSGSIQPGQRSIELTVSAPEAAGRRGKRKAAGESAAHQPSPRRPRKGAASAAADDRDSDDEVLLLDENDEDTFSLGPHLGGKDGGLSLVAELRINPKFVQAGGVGPMNQIRGVHGEPVAVTCAGGKDGVAGSHGGNKLTLTQIAESLATKMASKVSMVDMLEKTKTVCSRILEELKKVEVNGVHFAKPFMQPVDYVGQGLHDYLTRVPHPMDLGTVAQTLSTAGPPPVSSPRSSSTAAANGGSRKRGAAAGPAYTKLQDFVDDVRLVWKNARSYNTPHHDIHRMAVFMNAAFEQLLHHFLPYLLEPPKPPFSELAPPMGHVAVDGILPGNGFAACFSADDALALSSSDLSVGLVPPSHTRSSGHRGTPNTPYTGGAAAGGKSAMPAMKVQVPAGLTSVAAVDALDGPWWQMNMMDCLIVNNSIVGEDSSYTIAMQDSGGMGSPSDTAHASTLPVKLADLDIVATYSSAPFNGNAIDEGGGPLSASETVDGGDNSLHVVNVLSALEQELAEVAEANASSSRKIMSLANKCVHTQKREHVARRESFKTLKTYAAKLQDRPPYRSEGSAAATTSGGLTYLPPGGGGDNDDVEATVDKILDLRVTKYGLDYLVKWDDLTIARSAAGHTVEEEDVSKKASGAAAPEPGWEQYTWEPDVNLGCPDYLVMLSTLGGAADLRPFAGFQKHSGFLPGEADLEPCAYCNTRVNTAMARCSNKVSFEECAKHAESLVAQARSRQRGKGGSKGKKSKSGHSGYSSKLSLLVQHVLDGANARLREAAGPSKQTSCKKFCPHRYCGPCLWKYHGESLLDVRYQHDWVCPCCSGELPLELHEHAAKALSPEAIVVDDDLDEDEDDDMLQGGGDSSSDDDEPLMKNRFKSRRSGAGKHALRDARLEAELKTGANRLTRGGRIGGQNDKDAGSSDDEEEEMKVADTEGAEPPDTTGAGMERKEVLRTIRATKKMRANFVELSEIAQLTATKERASAACLQNRLKILNGRLDEKQSRFRALTEAAGGPGKGRSVTDTRSFGSSESTFWVQCCRPDCGKWRLLPPESETDAGYNADNWYCELNVADPFRSNCDVPQELENDDIDQQLGIPYGRPAVAGGASSSRGGGRGGAGRGVRGRGRGGAGRAGAAAAVKTGRGGRGGGGGGRGKGQQQAVVADDQDDDTDTEDEDEDVTDSGKRKRKPSQALAAVLKDGRGKGMSTTLPSYVQTLSGKKAKPTVVRRVVAKMSSMPEQGGSASPVVSPKRRGRPPKTAK